jgi:CBS domain-containing protein
MVQADAPASDAARLLADQNVRAVLVVDAAEVLVGVLSDTMLLRALLPAYVEEAETLAGVLDERAANLVRRQIEVKQVSDLIKDASPEIPALDDDDTLIEVASLMVRLRTPLVGVRREGRLIGGITINALLDRLLAAD